MMGAAKVNTRKYNFPQIVIRATPQSHNQTPSATAVAVARPQRLHHRNAHHLLLRRGWLEVRHDAAALGRRDAAAADVVAHRTARAFMRRAVLN